MKLALVLLLLAAPLTAQNRDISIVPAENTINIAGDSIFVQVDVMTDSVMIANLNRNLEALYELLDEANACNTCGEAPKASTTQKIAVGVLIPVLVWIAWELRGIKNNSAGVPGKDGSDGVDGVDGQDGEHHNHGHDKDSSES
jgi:hypothetical protein